eukprot:CAMPEP_0179277604 /NCGR_PEP_ID=MMETSP0797-20121207/35179_1 /TAXON_ID=47934 /ORGANISM="Dinophysis acuminata, Strain DAEP01" /LENGTH=166 /DNA_ID=CAMNT_0020986197 /DNA_START=128 /DNA_END=628 /DNA_ORIENTATION=+
MRDLDGMLFAVLVLRASDGEADIAYCDDGNVERGVPQDEFSTPSEAERLEAVGAATDQDLAERVERGLAQLAAEEEELEGAERDAATAAAAASMRKEGDRYIGADGSILLGLDDEAAAANDGSGGAVSESEIAVAACGAGLRGVRSLRNRRRRDMMRTTAVAEVKA